MDEITIRAMEAEDWTDVRRIYASGIATGVATFETEVPEWDAWNRGHRSDCRIVAVIENHIVVGWAALSNVSSRCVYAGVAELSIYIDETYRKRGIGSALMTRLISESESSGIWTLQAGILTENVASIRLHEKHGFRMVGVRERLGKLGDTWRDVALMERRSKLVGILQI